MYSIWTKVADGEYNEETATVNSHKLTVSSDRSGLNWDYRLDDNETNFGYDTKEEAQQAAIRDARDS